MKRRKLAFLIISAIAMLVFYSFFTSPIALTDVVKKDNIKEIMIYAYLPNDMREPKQISVDDKNNIDILIKNLNEYEYSKKIKLKNLLLIEPSTITANSDPFIQIWIWYSGSDEIYQQINIKHNNTVEITNKKRFFIEYKIKKNDKDVLGELARLLEGF